MLEKKNYSVNSRIDLGDGLINGQAVGNISCCRYGLFSAGFNACEMIAIYNLLKLNGYKNYGFADICLQMYTKTWALWGLFGSNVYKLHAFFRMHNIKYKKYYKYKDFVTAIDGCGMGMLSFWNKNTPFGGIHTVCIQKYNGKYTVYNMYNNVAHPIRYNTFSEITLPRRFITGYTIEKNTENN